MKDWVETEAKKNCESTTYESYKVVVYKHIIPYFKDELMLQDLKPIHLQKYYHHLLEKGRTDGKGGLSSNTVLKHHANIHQALEWGMDMQFIVNNVSDRVTLPKKKKFQGTFYSSEQIGKLLETVKGTLIEVPVTITIMLGLRRGEVLGLNWKNINLDEGTLIIKETITRFNGKPIVKPPKNESSIRTMPIPDELVTYIKKIQLKQKENKLQYGNTYCKDGYVCCHTDGNIIDPSYLSHKFKNIVTKGELPSLRFHDLRHSNASYLLKQGVSIKEIQVWLGHKQLSTTADIYSHVDMEMKKETAKKMNTGFGLKINAV